MDLQSSCLWNVWGWDLWPLATLVPRDREGTAASQSAVCWWWCFDSLWPEKICCHHRSSHELLTFSVRPEPRRFETQIRHSRWRGRAWRYRTAMQQQKHKGTQRLQKQYNHNTASLVCTYCYRLTPGHAKSWYPQRLATKCSETPIVPIVPSHREVAVLFLLLCDWGITSADPLNSYCGHC